MIFIERDVTTILADLAVVRERVHKLVLVRELGAVNKLE